VNWSIFNGKNGQTPTAKQEPMPDDLAGDAFKVMMRICESPAETIEQRCEKLEMDRAREFRARAELDERGFIGQVKQTLGGKVKFFGPLEKGIAWAKKRNIHIKKFKSGIVHEYILSQVEKRIGSLGPSWRMQRNSSIARNQALQPDLLVMAPDGRRIIVEVTCSNLDYDAQNIIMESQISGVDQLIAVTPDARTKRSLEKALEKQLFQAPESSQRRPIIVLEAVQCLADEFNWAEVVQPEQEDSESRNGSNSNQKGTKS
jgi:hypothetical protein